MAQKETKGSLSIHDQDSLAQKNLKITYQIVRISAKYQFEILTTSGQGFKKK